jgi:hypothetical protein
LVWTQIFRRICMNWNSHFGRSKFAHYYNYFTPDTKPEVNIVTCQPFVGLRNGALLGSRPVNNSSAQSRWRHTSGVREGHVCLRGC